MAAQVTSLAVGAMIDSVTTMADIQNMLHRFLSRLEAVEYEVDRNASGAE